MFPLLSTRRLLSALFASLAAAAAIACTDSTSPKANTTLPSSLALQTVTTILGDPVYATAPANDSRLFIVERGGLIEIFHDGTLLPTPFLDLTTQVSGAQEQGLLGMAFDPNYASNHYFYVYFTDLSGNIQIQRFTTSVADPNVANPGSVTTVLSIAHPGYDDENGGMLLFGPDGKLYIGTGYGGSPDDQDGNSQNKNVLLGKILRIDVSGGGITPYTIPGDNPFVGQPNTRGEIWAYGLRNPWRFAFDQQAGLLYIADVGDSKEEEIDVVLGTQGGDNFGWPIMEGSVCHIGTSCTPPPGAIAPVLTYPHSSSLPCNAIVGGFAYRGTQIAGLAGQYFYSDFCAGGLNSFQYVNGAVANQQSWQVGSTGYVNGFGEDASGELYLLMADGRVSKIVRGSL